MADYTVDNDNALWVDDEDAPEFEPGDPGLPEPASWWLLLQPRRLVKRSKGGLIIPEIARENQYHLNPIGRLLAMGPLAQRDPGNGRAWGGMAEPWIKPGDWLTYGRWAGMRTTYRGTKLLLLDHHDVLMRVSHPDDIELKL